MAPNLQYYLDHWTLNDPQPLAETFTSHVYTVRSEGKTLVLKLLKPVAEEERTGALALHYFDGQGAVRLLRDDDWAHLLEYLPGADLVPMVRSGKDASATAIIAQVLNTLHQPRGEPPEGLHLLQDWVIALYDRAAADQREGNNSIFRRGAAVAESLLRDPREERVLHGDIHHENIRQDASGNWRALDPKGLYGERLYDAANTFYNPMHMPQLVENEGRIQRNADLLAQGCGFDRYRLLAFVFAYGCLSAAWALEDGWSPQDVENTLRVAALAEAQMG